MHRMIDTLDPAQTCRHGHRARVMQDLRGPQFGGGTYVECACTRTTTCADRSRAVAEWQRMNGLSAASKPRVTQLRRAG